MMDNKVKEILKKQHYSLVGKHSAVQICRWTKKSLKGEGACYKEKFYDIQSHACCQMSPAVMWCPNKCLHCWRAIELTLGDKLSKEDSPKEIIDKCIKAQRKLLTGFKIDNHSKKKQLSKANQKKYLEAQEPMQFAISLSGEPTIYSKLGELIAELKKRGKIVFLVTNGLYPEKIKELMNKKQLPTQLYISLNSPNKKMYDKHHRSSIKSAWKKFNETLELFAKIPTRRVIRMTLIKNLNMKEEHVKEYAKLIKKAQPDFIEIKGYMSVGYARKRLGYEKMPTHEEVKNYAEKIAKNLKLKILDEHEFSRVVLVGEKKVKID